MASVQSFSLARSAVDLLLAAEKDVLYEGEVRKGLQNVLEGVIGHRIVAQLLPEISALSSFLYHCLSLRLPFCLSSPQNNHLTFQTLGEECCNLIRVSVKDLSRTTDATNEHKQTYIPIVSTDINCRLWLSLICAHLYKYVIERSRFGWLNLMYVRMTPRDRLEQQRRQHQEGRALGCTGNQSDLEEQPPRSLPARASILLLNHLDAWKNKFQARLRALESDSSGSINALIEWFRQFHLAIFYITATYLTIPNRLCKIQYIFTSDPTQSNTRQSRPNLSILGYIALIRLSVPVVVKTTQILKKWKHSRKEMIEGKSETRSVGIMSSRVQAPMRVPSAKQSQKSLTKDGQDESAVHHRVQRKCALCLEPRKSPAITPCGHVFCWECIVGWCQKNQPKCPLCRQEVLPQQIRSLYGYN